MVGLVRPADDETNVNQSWWPLRDLCHRPSVVFFADFDNAAAVVCLYFELESSINRLVDGKSNLSKTMT